MVVKNLLKDTATGSLNGRCGPDDVVHNLDTMLTRMRGIKRKLTAFADEEARLYRQVDARLAHLAELADMQSFDDVKYEAWSRRRLDRLLVDYLLRRGYNASAAALADDKAMRDLVDIETFAQMSKIQASLRAGSVAEALAWCFDNKRELRKMDVSTLSLSPLLVFCVSSSPATREGWEADPTNPAGSPSSNSCSASSSTSSWSARSRTPS